MEFWILDSIQLMRTPLLDKVMTIFTTLGNAGALWIAIAIVLMLFKKTRWVGIQVAIVLVIGALIGNVFLKNIIQRARPCWINDTMQLLISVPKDYSFPSGHTLASFSSATILFLNHRKWGVLALLAAGLMGFSRLYLYVHFPTDVLFSVFLGMTIAITVYYIANKKYKQTEDKKS